MSDPKIVHYALADLNQAAHDFRAEEGLDSEFSMDADVEFDVSVIELDIDRYVQEFGKVTTAYETGASAETMSDDASLARALIPPGTGVLRDFSYVGPEIPEFIASNCVACMDCVTQCPDTAILGKAMTQEDIDKDLTGPDGAPVAEGLKNHWANTKKFFDQFKKQGEPAMFGIFIDPTKCKGCGECVVVCGNHQALKMVKKTEETLDEARNAIEHFHRLPDTQDKFIREKIAVDKMLSCNKSLLFVGGAGSCAGCGEASALRMTMAQIGWEKGRDNIGLVAATGCNTVYSSTYPYNPYLVPWTNSLFENAPAMAMGLRKRWDQKGWADKAIWVIGGDGAMFDIGFGSLSRMMASDLDINVLILDTQVYSNTGGQASTSTFPSQQAKMAPHGKKQSGKIEPRKDVGRIAMAHPNTFVAQTTAAHANHFYRAISEAMAWKGPSVVIVYTTCQPEHGVGDSSSATQAKLAAETRAFPLMIYNPSKGDTIKSRLDLIGNPAVKEDWAKDKEGKQIDFTTFARSEGRFRRQFAKDGTPSEALLSAQAQVLGSWRMLQELAGHR